MSSLPLDLDVPTTALVLVDLQNFTVALDTVPNGGAEVLERAIAVADACRKAGVLVILVRVESGPDNVLALKPRLDTEGQVWNLPPGAHDFPASLGPREGDVVVTKYSWGGFHGTALEVQLRRRGIETLIVGGLVTNIGVDTTMRQAHERGYDQIVLTDVCAAFTAREHDYSMQVIFPRIARLRNSCDLLKALERP